MASQKLTSTICPKMCTKLLKHYYAKYGMRSADMSKFIQRNTSIYTVVFAVADGFNFYMKA